MKICPYHNAFMETTHEKNKWDEEGHCIAADRRFIQKCIPESCVEEGCAVYWDGHCHYKA